MEKTVAKLRQNKIFSRLVLYPFFYLLLYLIVFIKVFFLINYNNINKIRI